MITYARPDGPIGFLQVVTQRQGSVFLRTLFIAVPPAIFCVILKVLSDLGHVDWYLYGAKSVLLDNAVWSGFTFLVGFLIVFRTSQAYSRFWDGCTSTHMMRAEWFDACSAVIAFCKLSNCDQASINAFQNGLVAMFSMLHALALAELEDTNSDELTDIQAFNYGIVNIETIDGESLQSIRESGCKVEMAYQWIQQMLVVNMNSGVLNIPAPILSRVFQELANGMVQFNEAIKISTIPFPFPYAQTCDCLLLMHWLVTPFVISQWVTRPEGAFMFTFMQVFIVWSLRCIATEIENPFGMDENDIDAKTMQQELNRSLQMLLDPKSQRIPTIPALVPANKSLLNSISSLASVWAQMSQLSSQGESPADLSVLRSQRRRSDGVQRRASLSSCGSESASVESPPASLARTGSAQKSKRAWRMRNLFERRTSQASDPRDASTAPPSRATDGTRGCDNSSTAMVDLERSIGPRLTEAADSATTDLLTLTETYLREVFKRLPEDPGHGSETTSEMMVDTPKESRHAVQPHRNHESVASIAQGAAQLVGHSQWCSEATSARGTKWESEANRSNWRSDATSLAGKNSWRLACIEKPPNEEVGGATSSTTEPKSPALSARDSGAPPARDSGTAPRQQQRGRTPSSSESPRRGSPVGQRAPPSEVALQSRC